MDITYSQKNGVKITGKNVAVAIDGSADTKADVLLFSEPQSGLKSLTSFDGPGEFEVKGCMIDAIKTGEDKTAYRVDIEEVRLGYLPAFPGQEDKTADALSGCEVLFVPLSGETVEKVTKLIGSYEPKIVIPISYNDDELKAFLAEIGAKDVAAVEKYKFQRKDIADDKQEVVVLAG